MSHDFGSADFFQMRNAMQCSMSCLIVMHYCIIMITHICNLHYLQGRMINYLKVGYDS